MRPGIAIVVGIALVIAGVVLVLDRPDDEVIAGSTTSTTATTSSSLGDETGSTTSTSRRGRDAPCSRPSR